jgi:hypothetical protein
MFHRLLFGFVFIFFIFGNLITSQPNQQQVSVVYMANSCFGNIVSTWFLPLDTGCQMFQNDAKCIGWSIANCSHGNQICEFQTYSSQDCSVGFQKHLLFRIGECRRDFFDPSVYYNATIVEGNMC